MPTSRPTLVALTLSLFLILLATGCAARPPQQASLIQQQPGWRTDHGGIIRGNVGQKTIALVFTGGDYGEGAGHILDVLRQKSIKASFFVTGQFLAKPEHHPFLRRIVAEGHYVGPHSAGHLLYCSWEDRSQTLVTREDFQADLAKNIADLRGFGALRGRGPVYFIPPYEWFNEDQVRWANDMGVVLFNFTPGSGSNRDWIPEGQSSFLPSETILQGILDYEQRDPHGLNGFYLLLHLGSLREDKMFLRLEPLLDELTRRGYRFVTVPQQQPSAPER